MINIPHLTDRRKKPTAAIGRGLSLVILIIHNRIIGGGITGLLCGIQILLAAGSGDDGLGIAVTAPIYIRVRVIVLLIPTFVRRVAA